MKKTRYHTLSLHGGGKASRAMANHSKTPPIFQSSVFAFDGLPEVERYLEGDPDLYMYTRLGNPNVRDLELRVASIEGAEDCTAAASGMAAIYAGILVLCEELEQPRLIVPRRLYGGTRALLHSELGASQIEVEYADLDNRKNLEKSLSQGPALVYGETVSNPAMTVAPIESLADLVKGSGSRLMLDNTFLSPALFRPLEYGADLVVHSSTKYINGHSDATGGVVCGGKERIGKIRRRISTLGSHLNPFEAWLTLRGIQTLALRMERHSANAERVAEYLGSAGEAPGLAVNYPLSAGNPRHEENRRLFPRGCGGMLSFDLETRERAADFIGACTMIQFAPSLAGVQTTLSHPATTSHRGQSREELAAQGISEGTIRLSVGLEDPEDIIEDLRRGLEAL